MSEISALPHPHHCELNRSCPNLPPVENFSVVSQVFKQLSDPCRCRIFLALCHAELCVINLAALMNMSSPAVAHHLRLLKTAGLITSRREGKEVFYRASTTDLAEALHSMIEEVMHLSCTSI